MKPHLLSRKRVKEGKVGRVEQLPGCAAIQFLRPGPGRATHPPTPPCAVDLVPHHGVSQMTQMHPNLVGPPRLQRDVEVLGGGPLLPDPYSCKGPAAAFHHRHLFPVSWIPPDGRIHREG